MFTFGGFNAAGTQVDGVVEGLQGIALFVQVFGLEQIQYALHGLAHGVVFGKAVLVKQGIKHGLGDEMLGEHFNNFIIGNAVVQIVAQFGGEAVKGFGFAAVGGVFQNGFNTADMGLSDLGDVACQVFPIVAVAAFFDDFGV